MKRVILAAAVAALSFVGFAATTADYVQDGLVAFWDGIENGGKSRAHVSSTPGENFLWKDVVGDRAFTMLPDALVESDRVRFQDTADSRGSLSAEDSAATFDACRNGTLEVVFFGGDANTSAVFLYATPGSGMVVGRKSSRMIFAVTTTTANKRTIAKTYVNATNTFALSYSNGLLDKEGLCVNGVAQGSLGTADNYSAECEATWIGGSESGSTTCNGAIYAIRLYSRPLTPEEIAANSAVDVRRFIEGNAGVELRTLTAEAGEHGSVSKETETKADGQVCEVLATADEGFRFLMWEGNLPDSKKAINPLALTMHDDYSVRAVFEPETEVEPRKPRGEDFSKYQHSAFVTFDYTGATLTNFTALVKVAQDVAGFDYSACLLPGGQDVRFSLGDGEELPSEVGRWDPSGTSEFWVKLPVLMPNMRIMMFWGSATARPRGDPASAWDGDYSGVWHMEDEGAAMKDSSSYRNHGSAAFVAPSGVAGVSGGCRRFDETKTQLAACGPGMNPEFSSADRFTWEVWFRDAVMPSGKTRIGLFGWGHGSTASYGNTMGLATSGAYYSCAASEYVRPIPGGLPQAGEWHYIAFSEDSAKSGTQKARFYFDGQLIGSADVAPSKRTDIAYGLTIGGWYRRISGTYHNASSGGCLDEGRASTVQRPAAYFAAVYRNIADYDNFVKVEALPEEPVGFVCETLVRADAGDGVRYVAEDERHVFADGVEVAAVPPSAKLVLVSTRVKKECRVTLEATDGGSIEPSGEIWVEAGTNLAVVAASTDEARAFYRWGGDVPEMQACDTSIVVSVESPMTLKAQFGTIRRVSPDGGYATVGGAIDAAEEGDVVLISRGTYFAPADDASYQVLVQKPIAVRAEEGPGTVVFDLEQRGRGIRVTDAKAIVQGLEIRRAGNGTGNGFALSQTAGHVVDCVFAASTNALKNYALYVTDGRLQRSVFRNNSFSAGTGEGSTRKACVFDGPRVQVDRCVFTNNTDKTNYGTGASLVSLGNGARISNSLIADNMWTKAKNGVVYASQVAATFGFSSVENCTIANNLAMGSDAVAGGLCDATSGRLLAVNTIIEGNEVNDPTKGNNVRANCVMGLLNTMCDEIEPVDGCMQDSAKFVNAAAGDYRLAADSPAIDAGMVSAASDDPAACDVAGNKRIRNQVVDVGALEDWPTTLTVAGEPFEMGAPTPAYGSHACYDFGETISCTAPSPWTSDDGLTTADCIGYRLERGGVVTTGEDNSVVLTAANDLQALTWLWQVHSPLEADDPVYVSSSFGSAIVSANVTGFGNGTKAFVAFRYGTNRDALGLLTESVEVTELGTVEIPLPLIRNGLTYYVKAVLTNDEGESFESKDAIPFTQPEFKESGLVSSAIYAARDSLVAQWDGIDNVGVGQHDAAATAWADLSGNGRNLTGITSYGTFAADGFTKSKSGSKQYSFGLAPLTYEVVCDLSNVTLNKWIVPVSTTSTYYPSFKVTGSSGNWTLRVFYGANNKNLSVYGGFQVNMTERGLVAITCCHDPSAKQIRFYLNGVEVENNDGNYWTTNGDSVFGACYAGHSDSQSTVGHKFCAIRLYDTMLTDAECVKNYQIDKMRYVQGIDGGIPLETKDDQLVLTLPASDDVRAISLYSGKTYGGTNGWTMTSEPVTLQPGETTASFDLPTGWGTDALYARAKIVEGDVTYWSTTAFWEDPDGFVAVKGAPEELRADEVSPGYGRLSVVAGGVTEMTAPTSTITMEDGSHVFIGGWELYTKNPTTGEMELVRTSESPLDGESASKCLYTHEHYSELVWIWRRQDCVTVAAGENGSVDQSEVWTDRGSVVTVTATADAGYRFLMWEGDLTDGEKVINPLSLQVNGAASVTAIFGPEVAPRAPTGEDFSSYARMAYVTFNYAGETTLTNYTALVKVAQGVGGFAYGDCALAGGQDVRFSGGDGIELPSEVGTWNPEGTSEFWVKLPELKPQTRILMYWGNPSAGSRGDTEKAWDRYAGVWHMDDEGAVVKDSSSYRNHGAAGFVSPRNAGMAGACRTFNASKTQRAVCGPGSNLEFSMADSFTWEVWFKGAAVPSGATRVGIFGWGHGSDSSSYGNTMGIATSGLYYSCGGSSTIVQLPDGTPQSGEWHHIAFGVDSAKASDEKVKMYFDGQLVGSAAWSPSKRSDLAYDMVIGGWYRRISGSWYDAYSGGSFDEGRVSTVQRSADYIAAVYANIADYANFVSVEASPELAAGRIGETSPRDETGDGVRYIAEEGVHVFADGEEVKEAPPYSKLVVLSSDVKKEYKVTLSAGDGGTVEPSGELWVEPGSNLVVTATATDAAKAFYSWSTDCPEAQLFSSSIVVRVEKPMTLTANFGTAHRVTAEGGVTALTNAVAEAADGDVVLVGKGTYAPDGTGWQIKVAKPIAVRAEEGPGSVVFELAQSARGISVTKAGAVVEGFVISQAGNATAGYVLNQTAGQVNDCVFSGVTNASTATAINMTGGRLQRCVVRDFSTSGGNGGAANPCIVSGASTVVDGCVFRNIVHSSNWNGCANVTLNDAATLRNTLVADCSRPSDYYAGVRANGSVNALPLVENCTIVHNSAGHADSAGAGLFDANQRALVVNTIIEGNTVKQPAKGMNVNISKVTAALNTICSELPALDGCKQVEAGFKDAANGDYSIDGTSPAVDKGLLTAAALDLAATDVAGAARVYGKGIDIGAYEYAPKGDEPLQCSFEVSVQVGVDTLTVRFTPVVIGKTDGITYLWTFGDGETSTEASPTHTYSKAGNFTVKLDVATYDGEALIESATKTLEGVVRVLPSKVYVRAAGTSTPTFPYDTVETAANDLYTISASEYASGLVIDVDGTVKRGTYTANFKEPVKIVGHSPETSVISHGNSDILTMNTGAKHPASSFEIRNVKIEVSGSNNAFAGRILEMRGVVSNCVFRGKAAGTGNNSKFSGAVRLLAGSRMTDSTVEQLTGKWDASSSKGIEIAGGGVIVDRCVVRNVTDQCSGATLPTTVGVVGSYTPAPIIRNCYIAHNVCEGSSVGFGAIGLMGPAVVENCTIVSNRSYQAGAGIVVKATAAGSVIRNNIIWDNVVPTNYVETAAVASNIVIAADTACTLERNCSIDLKDVEDNIAADPQLNWSANPKLPPYAIGKDSPCRNRGKKEPWMDGATDLDGQKRSFNGKPDIGCYESQIGGTVIIVR